MRRFFSFCAIFILSALTLGLDCHESLPPYTQPDLIYYIELRTDQPNPEAVVRSIGQVSAGKGGISFSMDVTNIFDETLHGSVENPLGEVSIWWVDNPSVQATLSLTTDHELVTHLLDDPQYVYFNPGDSIKLAIIWLKWEDDQGNSMWDFIRCPYP